LGVYPGKAACLKDKEATTSSQYAATLIGEDQPKEELIEVLLSA